MLVIIITHPVAILPIVPWVDLSVVATSGTSGGNVVFLSVPIDRTEETFVDIILGVIAVVLELLRSAVAVVLLAIVVVISVVANSVAVLAVVVVSSV